MAKAPTANPETANPDANASYKGEARIGRIVRLMSVNGIRRAGIRFPAGQEVDVDLDNLTPAQIKALETEPELRPVR